MGTSFHKVKAVLDALERTKWALFPSLRQLTDDRSDAARRLLEELAEAVAADEYAVALGGKLSWPGGSGDQAADAFCKGWTISSTAAGPAVTATARFATEGYVPGTRRIAPRSGSGEPAYE